MSIGVAGAGGSLMRRVLLAILLPVCAAALVAAAAAGIGRDAQDAQADRAAQAAGRRLGAALADLSARPRTMIALLADRADLVAALAAPDPASLDPLLDQAWRSLRGLEPQVALLEVTDAHGWVLRRAQDPARAGDSLADAAEVAAALHGQAASGAQVAGGVILLGAALPVRQDGRVLGTLRVGVRLDSRRLAQVEAMAGGEVAVLVGASIAAGGLPTGVAPQRLAAAIPIGRGDAVAGPLHVPLQDSAFAFQGMPLRDAAGRPVAMAFVAVPAEPSGASGPGVLWSAAIALLVVVPAAAVGGWRLLRPVAGAADAVRALAEGDLRPAGAGVPAALGLSADLERIRAALAEAQRQAAAAQAERAARERRSDAINQHTEEFSLSIGGVLDMLGDAATRLQLALASVVERARRLDGQATGIADAALGAAGGLDGMIAATTALSEGARTTTGQITATLDAARATAAAAQALGRAAAEDAAWQALSRAVTTLDAGIGNVADAVAQQARAAAELERQWRRLGEGGQTLAATSSDAACNARIAATAAAEAQATTEEIAAHATTIRGDIAGFLHAIRTDTSDRRQFERIPAPAGEVVDIVLSNGAQLRLPMLDLSDGGVGLGFDRPLRPGLSAQVTLPGCPASVSARVARSDGARLGLIFAHDATTTRLVAEVLARLEHGVARAA